MSVSTMERPAGAEDGPSADTTEAAFEAISAAAPEGWRVELIEGEIHVVPPANGEHEEIVAEISGQSRDNRKELRVYTGLGLTIPDAAPSGKVIPDVAIAPRGSFRNPRSYHDPDPVLLVAEVTSGSTGETDRTGKLRGYAAAGIPLYLLVDRAAGRVVLHSEPADGHYTRSVEAEFGKFLTLPDPLGFELDTSDF